MIRVCVADDHPLVLRSTVLHLSSEPTLEVVGQAANGAQALELARRLHPDVLLLDIGMPVMDGLEVGAQLRRERHAARLVYLTMYDDDATLRAALGLDAEGFLLKSDDLDDVLAGIRAVAGGQRYWSRSVAHRMATLRRQVGAPVPEEVSPTDLHLVCAPFGDVVAERDGPPAGLGLSPARHAELRRAAGALQTARRRRLAPFEQLSTGEQEVLAAIIAGKAADVIATERFVSLPTVRAQIRSILTKLGVHSQLAAVALARRAGWPAVPEEQLVIELVGDRAGSP